MFNKQRNFTKMFLTNLNLANINEWPQQAPVFIRARFNEPANNYRKPLSINDPDN